MRNAGYGNVGQLLYINKYLVDPWCLSMYKQIAVTQLMQEGVTDGHQDAHFQALFVHHGSRPVQASNVQQKMWPLLINWTKQNCQS